MFKENISELASLPVRAGPMHDQCDFLPGNCLLRRPKVIQANCGLPERRKQTGMGRSGAEGGSARSTAHLQAAHSHLAAALRSNAHLNFSESKCLYNLS